MADLRIVQPLSERDMVGAYFRIVERLPWRDQKCGICGHARHCTPCPMPSEDAPEVENCGCGWRDGGRV